MLPHHTHTLHQSLSNPIFYYSKRSYFKTIAVSSIHLAYFCFIFFCYILIFFWLLSPTGGPVLFHMLTISIFIPMSPAAEHSIILGYCKLYAYVTVWRWNVPHTRSDYLVLIGEKSFSAIINVYGSLHFIFVGLWSDEIKLEIVITFWDFPQSSPE